MSVVIPTRNRALLLRNAIDSALGQTHEDMEIIVVDDASQDATKEVVRSFDNPKIRYVRQEEKRGACAARNLGVAAAKGDYIAFLDDDDEWTPEKTTEQLHLLRHYHAAVCMYSMGEKIVSPQWSGTTVTLDELRRGFVRGASASALMCHAHVAREIGFDEELPRCQDWDVCIRIARKYSIGCIDRPLVRYNNGAHARISNRLCSLSTAEVERQLAIFEKHKAFFGARWYRRHRCRLLLYGVSRRPDRLAHVFYAMARCGTGNVLRELSARAWSHVRETGPRSLIRSALLQNGKGH